jgi:hypothetical protein
LIFDPVLLITTIAKENASECRKLGVLEADDSYVSIDSWDLNRWQRAVNTIQGLVLGTDLSGSNIVSVEYLNSMKLNISREYLQLDDHELEEKIVGKFPFLKPKNRHAGDLMIHIVDSVLVDYPARLPRDLLTTFEELLS